MNAAHSMTAKRLTRIAHIVNGTLLVLLFVGSLWVYPSLPESIPTGTSPGTVHYAEKTILHWLTGPLFALGMTAFLYVLALSEAMTVPLSPFVNFGNRDTYEQLSTPHKQIIARLLRTGMYWMCTLLLLTFAGVQIEFYRIAIRPADDSTIGWQTEAFVIGSVLAFTLAFFGWWVPRRIEHLAEGEQSE